MAELLIDSMPLSTMSLEESKAGGNKIIMRGQFARSDRATENKRLYKEQLWRREFGRLKESIDRRRMFGELDHPNDGRTKLARVSHLVTSLDIRGDEVIGEAEILDTPNGRILKALAAAKAEVGVSSRGYGSTKTLSDGTQEVQEDFRLDTFDFVADPATKTAYPEVVSEERAIHEAEETMTLDILKEKYPGLVAEAASDAAVERAPSLTESEDRTKRQLTEQFSVSLRRAIELIEDEVRDEVRSELMSDPKVAGAYGIVEQIVSLVKSYGIDPQANEDLIGKDENIAKLEGKIQDKALEIHALEKKISEQSKLMREMANKLRLEQLLAKDPSREAIEALIGDVSKCESLSEIDEKVKAVRAELDRRAPEQSESEDDKVSEISSALEDAKQRVAELEQALESEKSSKDDAQSEVVRAREVAEKAIAHAENLEARLHAEEVMRSNASLTKEDASVIRSLVEDSSNSEDVDKIIDAYKPRRTKDSDEVSKIREAAQRGKSHDLLEEHGSGVRPNTGSDPLSNVVGLDGAEFDRLVGPANKA